LHLQEKLMQAKSQVSDAKVEAAGFSDKLRGEKKDFAQLQQTAKLLKAKIEAGEK
jgi:hypothetical protein